MIRFENVTKRYRDGTTAVDSLDLTAPKGSITVLVGPSGCGKTTSLRMVNRLITPTEGRISIDGRDTAEMDTAELRRGIGYVIQHAGLFPHRTVAENIGAVPRLIGWTRRKARARALELLEMVGLPLEFADRYPAQLSGGQQQRVGVARALAADSQVMLMDEPFSAVDPIVRTRLQEEFRTLQAELGKTIILVTHDIDEAITLGDQVAVFAAGGRLAQVASPVDLLARPANDFVADFVGRDRGYRALGFTTPPSLLVFDEPSVAVDSRTEHARKAAVDDWILVLGETGAPLGWLDLSTHDADAIRREDVNLGGTVSPRDASTRELLGAALSSPSGRGVVVNPDGTLHGTVTAADLIRDAGTAQDVEHAEALGGPRP
ncbi:ABC transporter ATP-binding protein [Saccharopolyspora shandongensis]|uniref:ABC transporter ATP-binding protein n=1 Tax=Saccharopolyspora shandongensis TaxID=418495 RepID=UPI0033E647F8